MKFKPLKISAVVVSGIIAFSALFALPHNAYANDGKEIFGAILKGVLGELGKQNGHRRNNRQQSQTHFQENNRSEPKTWDDVARRQLAPMEQQGIPYHHPSYTNLIGVFLNGKGQFSPAMDQKLRRILRTCCHDHWALAGQL